MLASRRQSTSGSLESGSSRWLLIPAELQSRCPADGPTALTTWFVHCGRNSSKADSNGPEWAPGEVIDSQRILVRAAPTRFGNVSGVQASSRRKACSLRSSARGPRMVRPARDPAHSIDLQPPRAPLPIQRSGCNVNELPRLTRSAPQRTVRMRPPRSELSIYAAYRRSSAAASLLATNHCPKKKDSEIVRHAWYCQ